MLLDRVTLKQGKTHCGQNLIMAPIARVVTDADADADADLEQNRPSSTKSIDLHVSLTSKYGSRVPLAA